MRGRRRGLGVLAALGLAAAGYALAAWTVPPGFYDGLQQAAPYHWLTPPTPLANGNVQPEAGTGTVPVMGGETAPQTVYTGDGQLVLSFLPGAFRIAPGTQSVTVSMKAVADYPTPTFTPATNVYQVTASAPLVKQSAVELTYSDKIPAPAYIYVAPDAGSGWQNIGASAFSAVFTISAKTSTLGYFAGGYTAGKPPPSSVQVGGGQALPIVVAAIIVLVLLGGVPLALRRRADGDGDDDGGRGDDPDPAEGGGGPDRGG